MDDVVSFAVMRYVATFRELIETARENLSAEEFAEFMDCILTELEQSA